MASGGVGARVARRRRKPSRRRWFHPKGVALAGTLTPTPELSALLRTDLFEPPDGELPGEWLRPTTVRVSRGLELPVLRRLIGVAIKVEAAYGAGRDQDFILMSSSSRRVLRRILWPARRVGTETHFSSLAPYEFDDTWLLVGARFTTALPDGGADPVAGLDRVTPAQPVDLELLVARRRSAEWRSAGRVRLLATMGSDAMRFTPATTGADIRPIGIWNAARPRAYGWFQRGGGPAKAPSRRRVRADRPGWNR